MQNKKKKKKKKDVINLQARTVSYTCPYINEIQTSLTNVKELICELQLVDENSKQTQKDLNKILKIIDMECIGLTTSENKNKGNTGLEKIRELNSALRSDKETAELTLIDITRVINYHIEYEQKVTLLNK
jgi:hypothetical protein